VAEDIRPIALVVEDREEFLDTRLQLLNANGFLAIGATNERIALQELRATPAIDLIVTDINLDPTEPSTKAGIDLAWSIRAIDSSMPIIGYSAAFAEGDIEPDDKSVFDDYLSRGALRHQEIEKHIELWRQRAYDHRQQRTSWAARELTRLRTKYGGQYPDYSTLRVLQPSDVKHEGEKSSADLSLHQAGYRLRIVEPGTSRPSLRDESSLVISPLIMWLRDEDTVTVTEIYGYPELYAFGDNDTEAIQEVLLLMDGFHKELVLDSPPDNSMSPQTLRLRDFLKHVFG